MQWKQRKIISNIAQNLVNFKKFNKKINNVIFLFAREIFIRNDDKPSRLLELIIMTFK